MNRQQKDVLITDLRRLMSDAQATFLLQYKGLSVPSLQELRKSVRKEGGSLKVAKASLMRRAAEELDGTEKFAPLLKDQVCLVFANKDVSATAKNIVTFAQDNENLLIVAGFSEAQLLSKADIQFFATLPPREILIGQLLGTMQAPIASFIRILHLLLAKLVYVLKQIEEKQQAKN